MQGWATSSGKAADNEVKLWMVLRFIWVELQHRQNCVNSFLSLQAKLLYHLLPSKILQSFVVQIYALIVNKSLVKETLFLICSMRQNKSYRRICWMVWRQYDSTRVCVASSIRPNQSKKQKFPLSTFFFQGARSNLDICVPLWSVSDKVIDYVFIVTFYTILCSVYFFLALSHWFTSLTVAN